MRCLSTSTDQLLGRERRRGWIAPSDTTQPDVSDLVSLPCAAHWHELLAAVWYEPRRRPQESMGAHACLYSHWHSYLGREIGRWHREEGLTDSGKVSPYAIYIGYITMETEDQVVLEEEDEIPHDCRQFCETHEILAALRACMAKARDIFSNCVSVTAEYDRFPPDEYEEEGHVVVRVEVKSSQDQAFQDYGEYVDWMSENLPDDKADLLIITFSRIL